MNVSVVTICFNNLDELKTTLKSVDEQTELPFEHWIIDGSSDSTIKEYLESSEQPNYRKWLCESDKGISDALNKGIERCSGEIVHLLHSADYYFDAKVIENVMTHFNADHTLTWTHGQYKQFIGESWITTGKAFDPDKLYKGMQKLSHPTMFVKAELYKKYGLFKVEKKLAMDFDFIVRIRDEKFKYLDFPITVFAPGGASNINWKAAFKEVQDSYEEYIGKDWRLLLGKLKQHLFYNFISTHVGKWYMKRKHN